MNGWKIKLVNFDGIFSLMDANVYGKKLMFILLRSAEPNLPADFFS